MSTTEITEDESAQAITNENEIFKSLSHQIRRNIIKSLGEHKELTFTEIKNKFTSIDSPTLAYHLKSLKLLLTQNGDTYILTDIGQTALLLMDKIDQSDRLKNWKKNIMLANIITSLCWVFVQIFVPVTLSSGFNSTNQIIVLVILNIVPQIAYQVSWRMWAKSWNYNPGKKEKKKK